MRRRLLMTSLLIFQFALAGSNAPGDPTFKTAEDAKAVEAAMKGYAEALWKGTPQSVAAFYADDGQLLLPGMEALRGPKAILDFLAPLAAAAEVESVEIQTETIDVRKDSADQWGMYRQVAGPRGKPRQTFQGRFAAIWHMGKDGRWRLFRLMMQPV